jgi:hypothetical protein
MGIGRLEIGDWRLGEIRLGGVGLVRGIGMGDFFFGFLFYVLEDDRERGIFWQEEVFELV